MSWIRPYWMSIPCANENPDGKDHLFPEGKRCAGSVSGGRCWRALLAGVSAIAITFGAQKAGAAIFTFDYTGATVMWTVPQTGLYDITAFGAQGGNYPGSAGITRFGGLGAEAGGDITLTAGEILTILVGGQGESGRGAGGGGGSFVTAGSGFTVSQGLLVAAGGGGGSRGSIFVGQNFGQTTTAGQNGFFSHSNTGMYCFASSGGAGGSNGGGGGATSCAYTAGGGGGAGVNGAGADGAKYYPNYGDPSKLFKADNGAPSITSFGKGAGLGVSGGFGGGGGGSGGRYTYTLYSAGGGGGYSGGGGGGDSAGGGGGSFVAPGLSAPTLVAGVRSLNGLVTIDAPFIADVPEPASSGLLAAGVAGLGFLGLRRGRKGEPPKA